MTTSSKQSSQPVHTSAWVIGTAEFVILLRAWISAVHSYPDSPARLWTLSPRYFEMELRGTVLLVGR